MGATKKEQNQDVTPAVDETPADVPTPDQTPDDDQTPEQTPEQTQGQDQQPEPAVQAPQGCTCGEAARIESYPATRPNGQRVTVTRCQRCGAHEVTDDGE